MGAWFTEQEQGAVQDYWTVYQANFVELGRQSVAAMAVHPEFGPLLRGITPEQLEAQNAQSRVLMERAIKGDWEAYEANLRTQGATFAQMGISFSGWYDVTRQFSSNMVPKLIARFGAEPHRLAAAIGAMQRWMDRAMAVLGQTYIDTKHALLLEERRVADARAEALRASEERYRMLFEASPMPMWVFELGSLRFLAVNDAAIRHYGYSRDEFLRMTIREIRLPDDQEELTRELQQLAPSSDARVWRHRKKNGEVLSVEVTGHEFSFDGKQTRLVLAHDITERQQLEQQLRQAQKMDAVGQLAGGVAHDFNNLLTAMISFARFVAEDIGPKHPSQGDLQEVLKAGERAAALTRQLLAFSRREVLRPEPLNVNEVVTNAHRMLERLIGEDIDIELALAPGLSEVIADRGHLEQVILNLVVNARDAMPHGGKLTLETANVELDDTYVRGHIGARPGPYVMLAVTDTGVGMDEVLQTRIFEPFFTTKGAGQGTGLGLSTVFGIVKQGGGDIRVYSAPGRGTTFKVYLPRGGAPAEAVTRPVEETVKPGTETILLVEDDDAVRAVARRALARGGYQILEAGTPSEARRLSRDQEHPIDLLVTDVVMPEMNGRALADQLRSDRPELQVLFMSGYTGGALSHQGIVGPDTSYIQKPFTPDGLLLKVRSVLDARRAQ